MASEAVAAVPTHAVKIIIFQRTLAFGAGFWIGVALLGAAMAAGTWAAKCVLDRLDPERFRPRLGVLL